MGYLLNIPTDKWAHFAWSYILVHTPATIWGHVWWFALGAALVGVGKEVWDVRSDYSTKPMTPGVIRTSRDSIQDLAADAAGIAAGLGAYYLTTI